MLPITSPYTSEVKGMAWKCVFSNNAPFRLTGARKAEEEECGCKQYGCWKGAFEMLRYCLAFVHQPCGGTHLLPIILKYAQVTAGSRYSATSPIHPANTAFFQINRLFGENVEDCASLGLLLHSLSCLAGMRFLLSDSSQQSTTLGCCAANLPLSKPAAISTLLQLLPVLL